MNDWDVVSVGSSTAKQTNPWDVVSVGKQEQPFSFKQMGKNIPSSAMNFVSNIGTALTHPAATGISLIRTAAGGIGAAANAISPGSTTAPGSIITPQDTQAWDSLKNFMSKRYGSIDALKQTIQNDPVGFSADISAGLGIASKAAELSGLSQAGKVVSTASKLTNPVNIGRGAARLAGEYIAKPVSEGIAGLSGIQQSQPGTLEAEFKEPLTIFSPGKKSVSSMYEQSKTEPLPEGITDISKNIELVDTAKQLDKEGNLTPEIALEAKKALQNLEGKVPDPYFRSSMDILNKIEKPVFGNQDIAYQKASQAETMRNLFPINKDKSASLMRTLTAVGIGGAASHYAGINPLYGLALSPYAQGLSAGLLGSTTKVLSPVAKLLVDHPELSSIMNRKLGLAEKLNK